MRATVSSKAKVNVRVGGRRCRGDDGQVAGIEVISFGLLTFVVGSLLITNAWAVVDAKLTMAAAAREAARAYVEAPGPDVAPAIAQQAARDAVSGHGRDPDKLSVVIDHASGAAWGRCTRITTTASYSVPSINLPFIGGYGHSFDVRSSHSEVIDPYRAGIAGATTC